MVMGCMDQIPLSPEAGDRLRTRTIFPNGTINRYLFFCGAAASLTVSTDELDSQQVLEYSTSRWMDYK